VFQCTDTSAEQEKGYNCIIYTGLLFISLMLSNALTYTTDYNRIAWCSFSAIWAPTHWKCSNRIYIPCGWYNLSFVAWLYDTNNNIVNVMDRIKCWNDMIALRNIVLLFPSLSYRCEVRVISPPEYRPILHRITPAEIFDGFWTVTVKALLTIVHDILHNWVRWIMLL